MLAGAGVVGAAFGRAIGYGFGTALALVLARQAIGARGISLRGSPAGRLREIAGYAGALLIIDAVFAALTQIDILLIGAILGTSAVGIFQAPAKLITFLHYPGLALSAGVSPRLSRGGDRPERGGVLGGHPVPDDPPGAPGRADDRVGGADHGPGAGRRSSPSLPR